MEVDAKKTKQLTAGNIFVQREKSGIRCNEGEGHAAG